jgi:hypothetical protein
MCMMQMLGICSFRLGTLPYSQYYPWHVHGLCKRQNVLPLPIEVHDRLKLLVAALPPKKLLCCGAKCWLQIPSAVNE